MRFFVRSPAGWISFAANISSLTEILFSPWRKEPKETQGDNAPLTYMKKTTFAKAKVVFVIRGIFVAAPSIITMETIIMIFSARGFLGERHDGIDKEDFMESVFFPNGNGLFAEVHGARCYENVLF